MRVIVRAVLCGVSTVQSRYSERKYSEQSRFSEPFAVSHFIIVME